MELPLGLKNDFIFWEVGACRCLKYFSCAFQNPSVVFLVLQTGSCNTELSRSSSLVSKAAQFPTEMCDILNNKTVTFIPTNWDPILKDPRIVKYTTWRVK